MPLKSIVAAVALLCTVGAASALTVQNFGSHTLTYDETTDFGPLTSSFTAGGGGAGFSWTVPNSVQVSSFGSTEVNTFALPSFTVAANAGWALSDIQGFLGNLVYTQVGGSTTGILIYADISVDGGAPMTLSGGVGWVETTAGAGFQLGFFGQTFGPLPGGFQSVSVSNASIALSASGGTFGSIAAQPQNKLEVSLVAMPVPEPQTYAMLLAGLGALGWLAKRRNA